MEQVVVALALALQRQGHRTSVLSAVWVPPDNQYKQLLAANNIPHAQWPLMRLLSPMACLLVGVPALIRRRSWSQAVLETRRWRRAVSDELANRFLQSGRYKSYTRLLLAWWHRWWRPDLFHIHSYVHESSLATILDWTRTAGPATVYEEHQTPDPRCDWWADFRLHINSATCVAAVSEKSAQVLRDDLAVDRPIYVVAPVVADPLPLGERGTRTGSMQDGALTLTTAARFIPAKGLTYLLEAVARVRQVYPAVRLRIYGDGPLHAELMAHARRLGEDAEDVFAGTYRYHDLSGIMVQTDIFVLSSITEGLPLTVIEAMAYGLPIVATAVGGIPEIVEDGVDGLLCPPADSVALADKILSLAESREVRERLGQAARRSFEAGPFRPDSASQAYVSMYDEALTIARETAWE